jgi:hypothetical protein
LTGSFTLWRRDGLLRVQVMHTKLKYTHPAAPLQATKQSKPTPQGQTAPPYPSGWGVNTLRLF